MTDSFVLEALLLVSISGCTSAAAYVPAELGVTKVGDTVLPHEATALRVLDFLPTEGAR